MKYDLEFLLSKAQDNIPDYKRLLSNKHNSINNSHTDISVIIGTKGRDKYLEKCLDYLKYSIEQSNIKAGITIVQHDEKPTHKEIATKYNVSYIFLPLDETNTENYYSRALAYNVGALSNIDTDYFIFHDVDVLFPHDYFQVFEQTYLKQGIQWLQNFYGKSVFCLNKDQSKTVFNTNGIVNLYAITNVEKACPGDAGKSLTCKKDLFFEVGGFDPEIFYGWAPEDSMFWTKLLCTAIEVGPIRSCHTFSHTINWMYADNPPMRLYHLFHEHVPNTRWGEMQEIHDVYWALTHDEKMKYIKLKKELLKL